MYDLIRQWAIDNGININVGQGQQLAKLVEEKFTSTNTARDEICRCGNKKDWEHIRNFIGWSNFNHCPECGGKLSPVA